MNKQQAQAYTKALEEAVNKVNEEFGLTLKRMTATIKPTELRVSLTLPFSLTSGTPEANAASDDALREAWNINCTALGLRPEHYRSVVELNGRRFILVGINLRAPKNPLVLLGEDDDRRYKRGILSQAQIDSLELAEESKTKSKAKSEPKPKASGQIRVLVMCDDGRYYKGTVKTKLTAEKLRKSIREFTVICDDGDKIEATGDEMLLATEEHCSKGLTQRGAAKHML